MADWAPRAAEGLWGHSDPQTLSLSPHGPFADLGDVLVGHGVGFMAFHVLEEEQCVHTILADMSSVFHGSNVSLWGF